MKSRVAILTLGEPIHKWEIGTIETPRNPFSTDDIQPPNSLPVFFNREFSRKHKIFLRGKKVICKMLFGSIGFRGCFLDIEGKEEVIDCNTFPLHIIQNNSSYNKFKGV